MRLRMRTRIPRAIVNLEGRDEWWDIKSERDRKKEARKAEIDRRLHRVGMSKTAKPKLSLRSRRFRQSSVKMKDTRPIEVKLEAKEKGINPKKRKAIAVRKERSFSAKDKKIVKKYSVINTVFTQISTALIPANAMKQDYYVHGTSMWRACGRRVRFRKNILYPSIKEKGIVDPLLLQFITNVPEKVGGFRCVIGNNRLTLLKEYPNLNIEKLPCFVINIKGEGGDFQESMIEGELIDSKEKALEHYKYTDTYLKHGRNTLTFGFNEDGWLIDVRIRRFLGEY